MKNTQTQLKEIKKLFDLRMRILKKKMKFTIDKAERDLTEKKIDDVQKVIHNIE